jgi:homospermidine synthase
MQFDGKVLVIGLGSVSRCTIPLLLEHLGAPPERYTVMDFSDDEVIAAAARTVRESGAAFVKERLTRERLGAQLGKYLRAGDLCVDLGWNIGCNDIVGWCHDRGVLYVNTSVEVWDPYEGIERKQPPDRTLYVRQMALRKMIAGWKNPKGPTAVLDHGANPGLVSHFAKVALEDIARKWLAGRAPGERSDQLQDALARRAWNHLARHLGVKVIHISERDTQVIEGPTGAREFVNTWSVEGLCEESSAPAEMGWGTHEKQLPPRAFRYRRGPRNQIRLDSQGLETRVRSWVPSGEMVGLVIPHSEAFTISEHLTVRENGRALYRPTVHFAYRPCDSALASLFEMYMRDDRIGFRPRVLADEIVAGRDELGVLLMGHPYGAWWTGSVLDIEEARRLAPHQNATTLQVAGALVAAVEWVIANPREGVRLPDELPHEPILAAARPYLGKFISEPVNWTPLDNWREAHAADGAPPPADEDVWQFSSFLLNRRGEPGSEGAPPAAAAQPPAAGGPNGSGR